MASDLKLVSKNVLIGEAEQMISAADRISDKVVEACNTFDGDLKGTFYPLEGMSKDVK